MSVEHTRGSGLGERGSHIGQVNGSGRMEAVLILPSGVQECQTMCSRTVLTLALHTTSQDRLPYKTPGYAINVQEKPGMISPVIIDYLLYARYQNEKSNNLKTKIFFLIQTFL